MLPSFAALVTAAALGCALTLACGVSLVLAYGPWRVMQDELDAIERDGAIPLPSTEALGGDPLEAAFALDAEPSVVAPVVWPNDRAGHGEHHIVREQLPEEAEYDAYRGDSVSEAKRVWHLITDNPPARGSITWYLPSGVARAHKEFGARL